MPIFPDKTANSVSELLSLLPEITENGSVSRWYRGQSNAAWQLVPTIARSAYTIARENALIKRFKQDAHAVLPTPPQHEWEWLFLMQHHGLPTRLLDWSENPLIALYFTIADESQTGNDGTLYCLNPTFLNTKTLQLQDPPAQGEFPYFGVDEELDVFLTSRIQNKPAIPPLAALAPRFFPRLAAQAGVFTIFHKEPTRALDIAHDGLCIGKIKIPATAKPGLRKELAMLGIIRPLLFPELDSIATHAKETIP